MSVVSDLNMAVTEIADRHGLTVSLVTNRTGGYEVKFAEKVVVAGKVLSPEQAEFVRMAPIVGVPAEWYGKIVAIGGRRYQVFALLPNSPKNCIKVRNVRGNGKGYVCSPTQIDPVAFPEAPLSDYALAQREARDEARYQRRAASAEARFERKYS